MDGIIRRATELSSIAIISTKFLPTDVIETSYLLPERLQ
jgi:hypothetical protein